MSSYILEGDPLLDALARRRKSAADVSDFLPDPPQYVPPPPVFFDPQHPSPYPRPPLSTTPARPKLPGELPVEDDETVEPPSEVTPPAPVLAPPPPPPDLPSGPIGGPEDVEEEVRLPEPGRRFGSLEAALASASGRGRGAGAAGRRTRGFSPYSFPRQRSFGDYW